MSLKDIVKAPSQAAPMPIQRFRDFHALTPLYIIFLLGLSLLSIRVATRTQKKVEWRKGRFKVEVLPLSHLSSRFRDSQALALGFLAVVVKADNKPAFHPPAF